MSGKRLRIGIDGRCLEERLTGIGRYVYELCRVLDRYLDDAEFFVYSRMPLKVPLFSDRWHSRVESIDFCRRFKSSLWLKWRCGALAQDDHLDVFWGAATFLPRLHNGIRTISTVYDLNYRIVPETMGTANLWAYRLFFRKDVLKADAVLTISRGTSHRLKEFVGREADGIIYPAINSSFTAPDQSVIQKSLAKYNVSGPYHLSVATWEPRKNLELLIRTYIDMKRSGELTDHRLVLAGGRGWKDEKLITLLDGAPSDTILPLGYVDDEDLPSLYAGATAFVFPSLYEGFGIPLLEARACGTTVIASDIPELRESGGDAIFIEPTDAGIRKGLLASMTAMKQKPDLLSSWDVEGKKLAEVFYL